MAAFVGQGVVGTAGYASDIFTTPFPHRAGDKARDTKGNEYIFCSFKTSNVSGGILVLINSFYEAAPLLGTANIGGRVGIAMTGATAGTNAGWVQVYGVHLAVQAATDSDSDGGSTLRSSDQTIDYVLIPQTSVTSPTGTLAMVAFVAGTSIEFSSTDANRIYGMWLIPQSDVSNITNAQLAEYYPDSTSPASVVSVGSGPVTLISAVTNGTSMHTGSSRFVYLNYPYVTGITESVGVATT